MADEYMPILNDTCNNVTDNSGTNLTLTNLTCLAVPEEFGGPHFFLLEFVKILYGIVCLVGMSGNWLVIYVVWRFSKMQTVTNMYIFNLAVADEMFLFGLPFLISTVTFRYWVFGRIWCKIYMTTTSINQFTSSLLLTVMSADRYVAVCHPISSPRYRTPFIAKFICLTAWTVSALLMVPIYMYANVMGKEPYVSCNIFWPESSYMDGQKAFTLYSFTLGFAIPLVLILLFYFLVICKLRTIGPKNKSREKKRSHRKVTYLVLTVITVYVICWLPYWIAQVYNIFLPPMRSHMVVTLNLLAGCLSYANSAMNPILYAFLSDNFKKSFAKAFTCAAGKDINAQLHLENSFFPKTTRGGSSRAQNKRNEAAKSSQTPQDTEQSTAITTASRSNVLLLQPTAIPPPQPTTLVVPTLITTNVDQPDNSDKDTLRNGFNKQIDEEPVNV